MDKFPSSFKPAQRNTESSFPSSFKPAEKKEDKFPGLFPYALGLSGEEFSKRNEENRRRSATAILMGQGSSLEDIQRREAEDPGFLLKVYDSLSTGFYDLPVMIPASAGGAAGGGALGTLINPGVGTAVGALAGAGASAFAATEAIKQIHRQYLEHKAQGGDLTAQEFFERAVNVLDPTLKAAVIGATSSIGGGLAGAGERGLAQAAAKGAGLFTGIETGKGAVGEFKTEEIPEDLANVALLKLAEKGADLTRKGVQNIRQSTANKPPPEELPPQITQQAPEPTNPLPGGVTIGEEVPLRPDINQLREEVARDLSTQPEAKREPTSAARSLQPTEGPQRPSPTLDGRVRVGGRDIGVRPTRQANPSAENEVGQVFSEYSTQDPVVSAIALKNTVNEETADRNNEVRTAYDQAEELTQNIIPIHIGLVENLERQRAELERISARSGPQNQKLAKIDQILRDLATIAVDPDTGRRVVTGYLHRSVADLLEQVKSINQSVDFDFNEARPSGIFLPLSAALNEAATLATQDHPEAAQAVNHARDLYIQFNHDFNNDIIKSYRDTSNHEYLKLYDKSLDVDVLRRLKNILDENQIGRTQTQTLERDLVNKVLKKYLKNPKLIQEPEFNQDLSRLNSITTPEQRREIRQILSRHQRPVAKGSVIKKLEKEKPKEITSDDVKSAFNSVSKIRTIRKQMQEVGLQEQFENLAAEKVLEIITGNQAEVEVLTGEDLYKRINHKPNHEILVELIGEQQTNRLLAEAKNNKNAAIKKDFWIQVGRKAAGVGITSAILKKALSLVLKIYGV